MNKQSQKYIMVHDDVSDMLYKVVGETNECLIVEDEFTDGVNGPIPPFEISKSENTIYELLEEEYKLFEKYAELDLPNKQDNLIYSVIYKRLKIK